MERRRSLAALVVLALLFGGANLFWTAHEVAANQAAQRRAGQVVEQKICSTFGKLARLRPPAGNAAANPSRAYEQELHVTLDQLGPDLGLPLMSNARDIDLGHDHSIAIAVWDPDLDLNPELRSIADQLPAKTSGIVTHKLADGTECGGAITFDGPVAREHLTGPFWTVESWDPLTLSPSLLCHCGDHGFIKQGKWVPA